MTSEVNTISGSAIPLTGDDIDTDRIIPARFLKCVTFDGLGANVFADDRAQNPQHPFNQDAYADAKILVVNRNFGCGSSREHAPQSIAKWGIEAIVGESFAEIFFGNCLAMGVPCVTATADVVHALQAQIAAQPQTVCELNLDALTITCGDQTYPVEMSTGPRQMLLSGTWDACGQLVAQAEHIQAVAAQLPYVQWSQPTPISS